MNICDICKKDVGDSSTDVWVLTSVYDEVGEPEKTGEEAEGFGRDYITICQDCTPKLRILWLELLNKPGSDMTKTPEQWEQHSQDLEKDESLYGQGLVTGFEIDLAFKDNGKGHDSWVEGTEFFRSNLEDRGWDGHSAGTGFGLRDMQFARGDPLTKQEFDSLVAEAKKVGIALEYMNQYGTNEWGEQSIEGTPDDLSFGA